MKQITEKIYQISLGFVNVFVIEDDGLTLVDTGPKGSADKIFRALRQGGKDPETIKRIILTHAHPDHAGSAAEISTRLHVPVLAHAKDARMLENGVASRQCLALMPGWFNWVLYHMIIKREGISVDPVHVIADLDDNDLIPIAGGIQVIYTPGHSLGHISLLVIAEKTLIAGDICANAFGLALSALYEDPEEGIRSIMKVAELDFDLAVFGHGRPIRDEADQKLRDKFNRLNLSWAIQTNETTK